MWGLKYNMIRAIPLAIQSSGNGEATEATSWVQKQDGKWELFTIEFGANIAMRIEPMVGMNPSVQVSASKVLVNPGEEVTLSGRGASIFVWDAEDGSISKVPGPQIKVRPLQTTTYVTIGSGMDLCNDTAYTTIYTREGVTPVESNPVFSSLAVYPNPGSDKLMVSVTNAYRGMWAIDIKSSIGTQVKALFSGHKSDDLFEHTFDISALPSGLYLVEIRFGADSTVKKWIKK